MNDLTLSDAQAQAVFFASQAELHKQSAVISAALSGAALHVVKARLSHGEFTPWIAENMPVSYSQCSRYMKLAKARPELLRANVEPVQYLDLVSELKLLTLDEDAAGTVRDIAAEEELNRKEIASLTRRIAEVEENNFAAERQANEWRKQWKEERDNRREIESKLKLSQENIQRLRFNLDEEVSKAVADEMKNANAKLEQLQEDKEKLRASLDAQRKRQQEAIEKGVSDKLKEQQDEITAKELQLQSLEKRIDVLNETRNSLDKEVGLLREHEQALRKVNAHIESIAIEIHNISMEGTEMPETILPKWQKVLANMRDGVTALEMLIP